MNVNTDKHSVMPECNKDRMQIAKKEEKYSYGKSQNWMLEQHRCSSHYQQCKQPSLLFQASWVSLKFASNVCVSFEISFIARV